MSMRTHTTPLNNTWTFGPLLGGEGWNCRGRDAHRNIGLDDLYMLDLYDRAFPATDPDEQPVPSEIIQGFPADVPAAELREIANKRADYHEGKAANYGEQIDQLKTIRADEPTRRGSRDAVGDLQSSITEHTSKASHLRFLAAHVCEGAIYRLDPSALRLLGIQTGHH